MTKFEGGVLGGIVGAIGLVVLLNGLILAGAVALVVWVLQAMGVL